MQISAIANQPNFKGIDVLKIKPKENEPTKVIAIMDEDTFERSSLPEESSIRDLEGPYGHPYSGRPIINILTDPEKAEQALQVARELKEMATGVASDVADDLLDDAANAGSKALGKLAEEADDIDGEGATNALGAIVSFVKDVFNIE